jgi:hypothetical protein
MPSTKKPRKRYRPRPVSLTPVDDAIAYASKLRDSQQTDLQDPLQRAFDGLRTGTGGWPAWCAMADGMNVAERLAQAGIASDRLPEIRTAQAALAAVYERHQQRNTWTLRGPELEALDFALLLHRVQLQHATQAEVAAAISKVQRCVQQALAGNASPDALMCVGQLGSNRMTA